MAESVGTSAESTPVLVRRYAQRFNAAFASEGHGVTSPLGAWLLLCLVAPAATGEARAQLEELLQTDADDAFRRATALLKDVHPAVRSAVALWYRREFLVRAFEVWEARLAAVAETGPIPSVEAADEWVKRKTLELIDRFPVPINVDTAVVFASALATKVKWLVPFDVLGAAELGGPWSARVQRVLEAPRAHTSLIVDTVAAGDVAVHAASSPDGLTVVSVIADPSVNPADIHSAAYDVAALVVRTGARPDHADRAVVRSLFDLPLGSGHAWTISERTVESAGPARQERFHTILPSWNAESRHDLLGAAVGFQEAARALEAFCHPDFPYQSQAVQAARASFSREGFEAAAATAIGVTPGSALPRMETVRVRTAEVRFNRPYAVVAVASPPKNRTAPPAWNGTPVFSAWVARPAETN